MYPEVVFDGNLKAQLVTITLGQNPGEENQKACYWDLVQSK